MDNTAKPAGPPSEGTATSLRDVAHVFLLLGFIGFGGPAAHVALMRREIVQRRQWVTEERFLQMFAACNLIPGPSSTELAIYLGYRRAGWRAMVLAGGLFILPAMAMMLGIAWAYTRFGTTPAARAILYGVRPVIVAVVLWALTELARKALSRRLLAVVAIAVFALALLNLNPILLLFVAGAGAGLIRLVRDRGSVAPSLVAPLMLGGAWHQVGRLPLLFLTFLKIGAVSFGSGYVLLAFLHADFVHTLHWLADKQLVDAVAIGQATPGPVFTTATFLGYLFAGVPGALLATLAIFLPGFLFVPFLDRLIDATHHRPWMRSLLDAVNAAVLGLIAAVTVTVARAALTDAVTIIVALIAFAILLRRPLASPVLVVAGAVIGLTVKLLV
ncbi:MAG: chromate efflux transporter [Chloroflexota bacterium]|nr:MAG: chromate transporter [Chloroflexota bacterium]